MLYPFPKRSSMAVFACAVVVFVPVLASNCPAWNQIVPSSLVSTVISPWSPMKLVSWLFMVLLGFGLYGVATGAAVFVEIVINLEFVMGCFKGGKWYFCGL